MPKIWQNQLVFILLLLISNIIVYQFPYGKPIPLKASLYSLPRDIGTWHCEDVKNRAEKSPLNSTTNLLWKYVNKKGQAIHLNIEYIGKFKQDSNLFSGKRLTPGKGWYSESKKVKKIVLGTQEFLVNKITFQKDGFECSTISWYQTNSGLRINRHTERIKHAMNTILCKRTNMALIRIFSEPYNTEEREMDTSYLLDFATSLISILDNILPFEIK